VWKNEKFTLTEIKFRQINYLVNSLVKPLLSRNFCQKSVRENFRYFHTVFTKLWQLKHFSLNQILREIKFGEGKSLKNLIFAISGALNFLIR